MSSIAARRANKRACPLQPNGILSRGTHGILAQMGEEGASSGEAGEFFVNYRELHCVRDSEHGSRFVTTIARKLNGYEGPHKGQLHGR
jgi:hypothetical protein